VEREFVRAEVDHVPVDQPVPPHALALQVDAVGAVEVLDHADRGADDDLRVMAAHELAVDLQVVVRRAANEDAPL